MKRKLMTGGVVACAMAAAGIGLVANAQADNVDPLIIGGGDATEDYGFVASMQYNDDPDPHRHRCGASLIDSQWLLTAAHCLIDTDGEVADPSLFHFNIGSNDRTEGTDYPAEAFHIHPAWDEASADVYGDIGLVKLAEPVEGGTFVDVSGAIPGNAVRTLGWGYTSEDDVDDPANLPTYLQELDSTVLDPDNCVDGFTNPIKAGEVCVDVVVGEAGPCFGDSGGPLLTGHGDRWSLVGITSRGPTGCVQGNGIFTDTNAFLGWIAEVTGAAVAAQQDQYTSGDPSNSIGTSDHHVSGEPSRSVSVRDHFAGSIGVLDHHAG